MQKGRQNQAVNTKRLPNAPYHITQPRAHHLLASPSPLYTHAHSRSWPHLDTTTTYVHKATLCSTPPNSPTIRHTGPDQARGAKSYTVMHHRTRTMKKRRDIRHSATYRSVPQGARKWYTVEKKN